MEWSNDTTLQFLESYHAEVVLWDPTHEHHKDKRKVHDAWCRLSAEFNRPVGELKKKKESLMATFRGHLRKKKASIRSGAGVEDVYKPVWFAFDYMEEFLSPVYEVTQNMNTENPIAQDEVIADDAPDDNPPAPAARQQGNSQQTIRRRQNPPELVEAGNQMREAFTMLQSAVNKTKANEKDEDECDLYGKMLAKKLKKLPEEERELVMYEIDGLILRRRSVRRNTPSFNDRPSSSSSSSTLYDNYYSPPDYQLLTPTSHHHSQSRRLLNAGEDANRGTSTTDLSMKLFI